jgi:ribonucleoside-diphosphate reductase alpha subunit
MFVTKRNGTIEPVSFDKIISRIAKLVEGLNTEYIDPVIVAQKVINGVYKGVNTSELDELAAEISANLSTHHPDYSLLAGKILVSNLHKNTDNNYKNVVDKLYNHIFMGEKAPLVSDELFNIVNKYPDEIQSMFDYNRDYNYDYFGFRTLQKSYLLKINNKTIERPQHLLMRVAIGIQGDNLEKIKEMYDYMSNKYYTHATPTLFNAGTQRPQCSSCFLLSMKDDSVEGIYDTLKDCALISKFAGGIGLNIHNIRANNSYIKGTSGYSNGIIPMLQVFNNTARYIDQCLTKNTIIYTKNGPICIKDVIPKETEIYTLNGLEVVQDLLENFYTGMLLNIITNHSINTLKITNEHPIYSIQVNSIENMDIKTIKKMIENNLLQPDFVEAKDLTENDYICHVIPEYSQDFEHITERDCFIYGIMLKSCIFDKKSNKIYLNSKKYIIDIVKSYLTDKYLYFTLENIKDDDSILTWYFSNILPFRQNSFYDEFNNKRIPHQFLNLPNNKIKQILAGIYITFSDITYNNKEKILYTTSIKFVENIKYLFLRLGILVNGDDNVNKINNDDYIIDGYTLSFPDINILSDEIDDISLNFIRYKNLLLTKIYKIYNEKYDDTVYDLQMKDCHNYLINNGLVHNGGGKRKGSIAIYLEPWHADIYDFLDLKKNHGKEESRARDLFYALWIPDLFMERVRDNKQWSLFCPNEAPGLHEVYGEDFNNLYTKYENSGLARKSVNAQDLFFKICESQIETGTPYMLYKDSCNYKSNQKNLGTIKSSNLCTEIVEYSSKDEQAVCNLASINLTKFVEKIDHTFVFNFEKLGKVTQFVTQSLNQVIDVNFYPNVETKRSNIKHRPIGIGVQGLADTFIMLKFPFESKFAEQLNKDIFETIYYNALVASNNLSKKYGPYESFTDSPTSKGILQFDLWNHKPTSDRYNWTKLKEDIILYGLRNSLLVAPMPTASTAQILGNNESFEPYTSNVYSRRVLAGDFPIVNKHLIKDLIELNLWNADMRNKIMFYKGSIQNIEEIPKNIKEIYKTVWEISQKVLINMAVDRGIYIDQSQSFNIHMEDVSYKKLSAMHFYGWKNGLKTGMYYLRSRPAVDPIAFTVEQKSKNILNNEKKDKNKFKICLPTLNTENMCFSCSS